MTALKARDAEQVLRFVVDAEDIGGDEPFMPEILGRLTEIIPADWVAYQEKHLGAGDLVVDQQRPWFDEVYAGIEFDCLVARDESPVRNKQAEGFFGAIRLTGLMTRSELRRTRYHSSVLDPLGVRDILSVAIPSDRSQSMRFQLDRIDSAFTERDQAVLDALRPHLARMRLDVSTRQRLRASLMALARAPEEEARGVVLVGDGGSIEFASPPARRLLRAYFEGWPLAEVLEAMGPQQVTEVRRGDSRRLRIERAPGAFLLEEVHAEPLLTPRERDVLRLVARGMTNAQIAKALWLAPSTVRKHLENVYAKLGVRTRTAAVARFLGVEDEARGL